MKNFCMYFSIALGLIPRLLIIKDIQTLYMKSMLIKAFLMRVLIFQLGLDGQSQTPFGQDDFDDVTATSGPGGGAVQEELVAAVLIQVDLLTGMMHR